MQKTIILGLLLACGVVNAQMPITHDLEAQKAFGQKRRAVNYRPRMENPCPPPEA